MRTILRFYLGLTRALGSQRRFLRRLAGICLILIGVHAAADLLDDLVFRLIDAVDLAVDSAVWWAIERLANWGTITEQTAAQWGQDFASWLEVDEKDRLALWLALAVELVVDLLLFDFAWGRRGASSVTEAKHSLLYELKESARELKEAFWPLDLERLTVIPTVLAFACAGAFLGGLAIESVISSALLDVAPLWRWGVNVAAAAGLLSSALLLARFLPDLLHEAIVRAHQRGQAFKEKTDFDPEQSSTVQIWRRRLQRARRGTFMAVVLLPVGLMSLASQTAILGLLQRTGANL